MKSQQELLAKQQQQLDLLTKMMERPVSGADFPHGGAEGGFRGRGRGRGGRRPYGVRGAAGNPATSRSCFKCGNADHFIRNCPQNKTNGVEGAGRGLEPQNLN